MNHEKNINKMRILTLVTLGENSKVISFDVLQQQLQIKPDEIESFVIDGKYRFIYSKRALILTLNYLSYSNEMYSMPY